MTKKSSNSAPKGKPAKGSPVPAESPPMMDLEGYRLPGGLVLTPGMSLQVVLEIVQQAVKEEAQANEKAKAQAETNARPDGPGATDACTVALHKDSRVCMFIPTQDRLGYWIVDQEGKEAAAVKETNGKAMARLMLMVTEGGWKEIMTTDLDAIWRRSHSVGMWQADRGSRPKYGFLCPRCRRLVMRCHLTSTDGTEGNENSTDEDITAWYFRHPCKAVLVVKNN